MNREEVFAHYGKTCPKENGYSHGIWRREEALERLKKLPELLPYLNPKRKIRITFDYDPDFPFALFTTENLREDD